MEGLTRSWTPWAGLFTRLGLGSGSPQSWSADGLRAYCCYAKPQPPEINPHLLIPLGLKPNHPLSHRSSFFCSKPDETTWPTSTPNFRGSFGFFSRRGAPHPPGGGEGVQPRKQLEASQQPFVQFPNHSSPHRPLFDESILSLADWEQPTCSLSPASSLIGCRRLDTLPPPRRVVKKGPF